MWIQSQDINLKCPFQYDILHSFIYIYTPVKENKKKRKRGRTVNINSVFISSSARHFSVKKIYPTSQAYRSAMLFNFYLLLHKNLHISIFSFHIKVTFHYVLNLVFFVVVFVVVAIKLSTSILIRSRNLGTQISRISVTSLIQTKTNHSTIDIEIYVLS